MIPEGSEAQGGVEMDKPSAAVAASSTKQGGRQLPVRPHAWLWNVGMLLGLALLVYHLLALWYRWLRPDPEFLAALSQQMPDPGK